MVDVLEKIRAYKLEEIAARKAKTPLPEVEEAARSATPPRGFAKALQKAAETGYGLIAEIKKASPSKGLIRADFNPTELARAYQAGGATCLSVLTDTPSFQGSDAYLMMARAATDLPVLRKEFIIDPIQIEEAAVYGADAILLIAAILETSRMQEFRLQAEEAGMDVLVEVHDEQELEKALEAESRLLGVNNRNLNDFSVDLATTFRLQKEIPAGIPLVSESGISSREDMQRLQEAGITAALIGESLMRSTEQGATLQQFLDL